MAEPLIDISVDNGKYRIIQEQGSPTRILRYGEPWIENLSIISASNVILAMAYELEELRNKMEK